MKLFNHSIITLVISLFLLFLAADLVAGGISDKIEISGQIRYRAETDDRDFDNDTDLSSYSYLRTRINLDFHRDSWARAFIQIQDSRMLGTPESGTLANDGNLGIHQAYLHLSDVIWQGVFLRYGRFEYAKGNQRFLGSVGWHNVGRTWDGSLLGYQKDDFSIEGFFFTARESFTLVNDDLFTTGIYSEIKNPDVDLFLIGDFDKWGILDYYQMRRFTVGGFTTGKKSEFDYNANFAYQFGNIDNETRDIAAWMIAAEAGYTIGTDRPVRLAVGADITSGDDGSAPDKLKAFSNLYYTGHKFHGFMDFFVDPSKYYAGEKGLHDYMLRVSIIPAKRWKIKGDFHLFQTNQDYISLADSSETKSLGNEVDLSVSYKQDRVTVQTGISVFLASDDWKGTDADPSLWHYFQITMGL